MAPSRGFQACSINPGFGNASIVIQSMRSQHLVINRLLNGFDGFLMTSKYGKLAKCSPDTALRDIQELLDRRILLQNPAGGRSTSYRLADPDNVTD